MQLGPFCIVQKLIPKSWEWHGLYTGLYHLRSKVFNHDAEGDPLLFQPSLFIKLKDFESQFSYHMNLIG